MNAWVPDLAIIDAMFIINTTPLRQHKIREHYADFLFRQYAIPHFNLGTKEVHFVFDHPGRLSFNPKDCEHKRRYTDTKNDQSFHIWPSVKHSAAMEKVLGLQAMQTLISGSYIIFDYNIFIIIIISY